MLLQEKKQVLTVVIICFPKIFQLLCNDEWVWASRKVAVERHRFYATTSYRWAQKCTLRKMHLCKHCQAKAVSSLASLVNSCPRPCPPSPRRLCQLRHSGDYSFCSFSKPVGPLSPVAVRILMLGQEKGRKLEWATGLGWVHFRLVWARSVYSVSGIP